jgi:hypothetical protein
MGRLTISIENGKNTFLLQMNSMRTTTQLCIIVPQTQSVDFNVSQDRNLPKREPRTSRGCSAPDGHFQDALNSVIIMSSAERGYRLISRQSLDLTFYKTITASMQHSLLLAQVSALEIFLY